MTGKISVKYYFLVSCFFFINIIGMLAQQVSGLKNARLYLDSRNEVRFSLSLKKVPDLQLLSDIVSIDQIKNDSVYCYADRESFDKFIQLNIPYTVLPPAVIVNSKLKSTLQYTYYPSYNEYLTQMNQFVMAYPSLCKLIEIGESVRGKKILVLKISDNVNEEEEESAFFYTSTMHGDEGSGFLLMLRFINYLLTNYSSVSHISDCIDNLEIFINPLANPDGFYFGNDTILTTPTRYNINSVDLNRNFPDPEEGENPDGHDYQPETLAMMKFMKEQAIALAATLHDGAEVINYPWDTWSRKHADNTWYIALSRNYADTVHQFNSSYMNDLNNGITNGWDWYTISGGSPDYVNYFLHGREVIIELSTTKTPHDAAIDDLWNYNRNSLINYMMNCRYGLTGKITDLITGDAVSATISLPATDKDNSYAVSGSSTGFFTRLLLPGEYNFQIHANGYLDTSVSVTIDPVSNEYIEIALHPDNTFPEYSIYPVPFHNPITLYTTTERTCQITIYDVTGRMVYNKSHLLNHGENEINPGLLKKGIYIFKITDNNQQHNYKITKY